MEGRKRRGKEGIWGEERGVEGPWRGTRELITPAPLLL